MQIKKVLLEGVSAGVGLRAGSTRTKNEKVGLKFTFSYQFEGFDY